MRKNNKAQTEILGLAIIVILIVLGMTLYLRFQLLQEPPNIKQNFNQKNIAVDFVSAMFETTDPGCYDVSVSTLIKDCASNPSITCDNTLTPCNYLKERILTPLLEETFDRRNIAYEFSIDNEAIQGLEIEMGTPCTSGKPALFPIPTATGERITVKLMICT